MIKTNAMLQTNFIWNRYFGFAGFGIYFGPGLFGQQGRFSAANFGF
jgi:hypothetical protein